MHHFQQKWTHVQVGGKLELDRKEQQWSLPPRIVLHKARLMKLHQQMCLQR